MGGVWDREELRRLYMDEGLSLSAIAALHGCSLTTVWRHCQAAGIQCREGGSEPKYARADFSGDVAEKAYLIGFRLGDLHVAMEGSRTIVVKCTSTRSEQIELFRNLFMRYGHVYTDEAGLAKRQRQSIGMEVRLNTTFEFMVPKQDHVPEWIRDRDETFFAFFAGYLDAEGYIRTYLPPGYKTLQVRIEIRTYDAKLLTTLGEELNKRGISCPAAQIRVLAGYVNGYGVTSNGEQWGLGVYQKESLERLFEKIEPHVRHRRRRQDMLTAWGVL